METPTESTQLLPEIQTPTPTPVSGGINGGGFLSNLFGSTNTEDIKLTSQNKIAELNTQIQTLQAEIKSKTTELAIKQNELKLYSAQKFSGGKKSKKSHKKSHKKSSRKTR